VYSVNDERGQGCPFCAHQKLCPDSENCQICYANSFATFDVKEKVKSFSSENPKPPSQYFLNSGQKVKFNCNNCEKEFSSRIAKITGKTRSWCPHCHMFRNKSMNLLSETLEKIKDVENVTFTPEVPVICDGRNLRWDMVIETELLGKIHIESDGPQHFSEKGMVKVSRGNSTNSRDRFVDQRNRDLSKEAYIRSIDGLMYRFSYRQMTQIPEFVSRMLEDIKNGVKGVIYLDDLLYKDWVKIN